MTQEQKNTYFELEKIFGNIENYSLLDVLNKIDILYKGEKNIFEILAQNDSLKNEVERLHRLFAQIDTLRYSASQDYTLKDS